MGKNNTWDMEIVATYPFTQTPPGILGGSFHIRLKNWGIEVRGLTYTRKKKSIWVKMPTKFVVENGKKILYPVWDITDKKEKAKFLFQAAKEVKAFLENDSQKTSSENDQKRLNRLLKANFVSVPIKKKI